MDYFGINSADDLPKINEVLMEELVQATNVQDAQEEMMAEAENREEIEVIEVEEISKVTDVVEEDGNSNESNEN